MERTVQICLTEILANKLERLAKSQDMSSSEVISAALSAYIESTFRRDVESVAETLEPKLRADGITEESADHWFKEQRHKNQLSGAGCA